MQFYSFNAVCKSLVIKDEDDYEHMVYEKFQGRPKCSTVIVGSLVQEKLGVTPYSKILIGFDSNVLEQRTTDDPEDEVHVPKCFSFLSENKERRPWMNLNRAF